MITYVCDNKRHLVGLKKQWFHKTHYDIPVRRISEIMQKCTAVSPKEIVNIIKNKAL